MPRVHLDYICLPSWWQHDARRTREPSAVDIAFAGRQHGA